MIRPVSKPRSLQIVNDYQVFKGSCENSMKPFGQPVAVQHEANLMIRDDRRALPAGSVAIYAIHQRSENRIIKIVNMTGPAKVMTMPTRRVVQNRKAA
jgi:hypothetical protein